VERVNPPVSDQFVSSFSGTEHQPKLKFYLRDSVDLARVSRVVSLSANGDQRDVSEWGGSESWEEAGI
jgi:hypothetical protein